MSLSVAAPEATLATSFRNLADPGMPLPPRTAHLCCRRAEPVSRIRMARWALISSWSSGKVAARSNKVLVACVSRKGPLVKRSHGGRGWAHFASTHETGDGMRFKDATSTG